MARKKKSAKQKAAQQREFYLRARFGTFENRIRNCLYERRKIAKRRGLEFDVLLEDFKNQTHCMLMKSVEFCFTNGREKKDNSPSIDRIDPRLGYTKDNVWVICGRANRIKNNATFEEFEEIYLNWKAEIERRSHAKRT